MTSLHEESDPVGDETDEDDDSNNNESSKGLSNADAFFALGTTIEWYEQQSEYCSTQLLLLKRIRDLAAKTRRCIAKNKRLFSTIKLKLRHLAPLLLFLLAQFPAYDDIQYSYSFRFPKLHGSHSVFGYPNNRVSERCLWSQLIRTNDVLLCITCNIILGAHAP
ncbi:uncharacterized protein TNCV_3105661 [Trichonephila clavipes]|nr:uncharacterized protein TNCV_3105661 [Trichonephila clavipes]